MASFGRTRLMGVSIKRFLTQVKRHNKQDYHELDEQLRRRYAPGVNQLFADTKTDSESRCLLRQQVAGDMHYLIQRFADQPEHTSRDTYKALERIFYEQCEVHEDKVCVKDRTGGNVMQNPSDPDATYDGHKGPDYQVQIAETCNCQNEVQLITCAIPQTAKAVFGLGFGFLKMTITVKSVSTVMRLRFLPQLCELRKSPTPSKAA